MNAFFPASPALFFSYQYPISRYEHSPTPSHPTNITRKLFPRTSRSMKTQKAENFIRSAKAPMISPGVMMANMSW